MSETRRSQRGAERGGEAAGVMAKGMRVPFIVLHTISMEYHNKRGREASRAYNFKIQRGTAKLRATSVR